MKFCKNFLWSNCHLQGIYVCKLALCIYHKELTIIYLPRVKLIKEASKQMKITSPVYFCIELNSVPLKFISPRNSEDDLIWKGLFTAVISSVKMSSCWMSWPEYLYPSQIHIWKLTPNVVVFGDGTFGRQLDHEGRGPMNGINPHKKRPES